MSASLIEERRASKPTWSELSRSEAEGIRASTTTINRTEQTEHIRRYSIPPVTDEEEMRFVKMAAIWMAILGMAPLILFHIVTFFYPDIFMIPVAP